MAISYLTEIQKSGGKFNVQINNEDWSILKATVKSHHKTSKSYKCFIEYETGIKSIDALINFFSQCAVGRGTI